MPTKLDFQSTAPEVVQSMYEAGKVLGRSGLEQPLLVLVHLRASQINRCAFCLALHTREAHALDVSSDQLASLIAWREAPWYSARERAALEWTEALTLVAHEHPRSELIARMKEHFSERELVHLTHAVNTINAWNRLCIAFGASPTDADAVFRTLHPPAATTHA